MGLNDSIEEPVLSTTDVQEACELKVYKKRWFILALFWFYSAANLMQFMLYAVIADLIVEYYGVSYTTAEWSAMICMLGYLVFMIPGSYILDTLGLRWSVIIGITGTLIGSWIKVFSINPSKYWILLVGQGFTSIFQVFVTPLPPKLAAVWFGGNQVSTACSIALVGIQVGLIVGILISPVLIQKGTIQEIESGLTTLAYFVAIYSTILLPIVVLFFYDSPPTPPSFAQLNIVKEKNKKGDFLKSLKRLLCNGSYMCFLISLGIIFGVMCAISINFNQLIIIHYPDNGAKHVSYLLTASMVTSLVGCFSVGILLDKFHHFKSTTVLLSWLSSLSLVLFVATISFNLYSMYVSICLFGLISAALFTIAFELGVELTYPEPEGTTGAFFNAVNQIFGIAFTYLHSYLLTNASVFWANVAMYCVLITGNLLMFGVKFNLRRQEAESRIKMATMSST